MTSTGSNAIPTATSVDEEAIQDLNIRRSIESGKPPCMRDISVFSHDACYGCAPVTLRDTSISASAISFDSSANTMSIVSTTGSTPTPADV